MYLMYILKMMGYNKHMDPKDIIFWIIPLSENSVAIRRTVGKAFRYDFTQSEYEKYFKDLYYNVGGPRCELIKSYSDLNGCLLFSHSNITSSPEWYQTIKDQLNMIYIYPQITEINNNNHIHLIIRSFSDLKQFVQ